MSILTDLDQGGLPGGPDLVGLVSENPFVAVGAIFEGEGFAGQGHQDEGVVPVQDQIGYPPRAQSPEMEDEVAEGRFEPVGPRRAPGLIDMAEVNVHKFEIYKIIRSIATQNLIVLHYRGYNAIV